MVDETVQAAKTAAVLDAVRRVREVLPDTPEELREDRTAREVVTLNLFWPFRRVSTWPRAGSPMATYPCPARTARYFWHLPSGE